MIARVGKIIMNFDIKGGGQPLTMISGMASDLSSWSLQVPSFALNFMTICLDNRGTGKTDTPDGPFSIEVMAHDTAKLLDVIGVDSSNVVGFGLGGKIALEMAITHPTKVKSLVLCSTTAMPTPPEVDLLRAMRSIIEKREGRASLAKLELEWTLSPRYLKDRRVAEGVVKARMARISGTSDDALLRQIEAVLDYDASGRLQGVKCPTLVVAGSRDRLVPPDLQRQMSEEIPKAKFLSLESSHMVLMEAAKDFNQNGIGFLMEQGA
ncbi:MAG: alpha/beta hydrolase [Methanomassiliicoccales archaeon]|jgi:pimeloyl-ACP methyl ester carboxylesterase|nr:alpha/beta hydrolase [Methanomassiliicoccales archaeon]MDD1755877.1 alpha/beta hydrolase [Methanomassiliicoccales archaeon]